MEMQHVRYYLALAETLNFTRAAQNCNVSQPALTRAIQQLEYELGGPLLRRERQFSHLTELGHKMLPLLRQCYESAISAKALATQIKTGETSCLSLGVAQTLDVALLIKPLAEIFRRFPSMQLKFRRGDAAQIAAMMKSGDIELAVGGPPREKWDRLDCYPMFTEAFDFIVGSTAEQAEEPDNGFDAEFFSQTRLLLYRDPDISREDEAQLCQAGIDPRKAHQIDSDRDLEALVLADVGVGIAPSGALQSAALHHVPCKKLDLKRVIAIYAVAGRRRSPEADALLALMRSADWSALDHAT